jgi:plastocyanin
MRSRIQRKSQKSACATRRMCKESINIMRLSATALLLVLTTGVTPIGAMAQTPQEPAAAPVVIPIRLSNFAFTPDHLRLRVGVPVRLQLVNESSGGHSFVAPAFFAASAFAPGSAPPPGGKLEVAGRTTVELTLIPRTPGSFAVECTHFLHTLFGMKGTIVVTASSG